jgi:hypothetical protein
MQAEQRDHGDGNLPAERSKPASQPPGPRALNNSPTSAMHTSSDCTASAPRRLHNLAEPRRMRPVLRHKGWLNPHAPGIPLRTQQSLPPRAELPHPPLHQSPTRRSITDTFIHEEEEEAWGGQADDSNGLVTWNHLRKRRRSTKRLLGRPRMCSEPLSRRVTQTGMGTARQRRWSELWTSRRGIGSPSASQQGMCSPASNRPRTRTTDQRFRWSAAW